MATGMSLISVQTRSTSAAVWDNVIPSLAFAVRPEWSLSPFRELSCSASACRPLAAVLEFRRRLEFVLGRIHARTLPSLRWTLRSQRYAAERGSGRAQILGAD